METRTLSHTLATTSTFARVGYVKNTFVRGAGCAAVRHVGRPTIRPAAAASFATPLPSSSDSMKNTGIPAVDSSPVLEVHSPESFQYILSSNPSKLVVLMCKATGCRPCRQFRRKYGKLASHYSDAIFCEVVGDESESTRKMMRELKIRATPTFLFYRNGEMVHTHSGINAQKMVDALKQAVLFSEAGYCSEVKFAADLLMADVDGHH